MKRTHIAIFFLFLLLALSLITACSMEISKVGDDEPAPTEGIITATLYPTFTPRATATPLPATAIPTVEPVPGKATAQINVRERPSTASEAIGSININSEVQIIGKTANENWYQVYFVLAGGEQGEGWVSSEYILTEGDPDVPVTSGGNTSSSGDGPSGEVTQQINVRSGPGTEYEALGMLNVGDFVTLTGKNLGGTWLQIEYASGEDGKGWLFAAYIQTDQTGDLPIVSEEGETIGIATQTTIAATASPVYTPAADDGDSIEEPAILVTFSTNDSRAFSYSSDLSSPEGDSEDWIAFHPNSPDELRVNLLIDLECSGNGTLYIEMWQGNIELTQWGSLECGDKDYELSMFRDETYQFRLLAKRASELEYINYTLQVRVAP